MLKSRLKLAPSDGTADIPMAAQVPAFVERKHTLPTSGAPPPVLVIALPILVITPSVIVIGVAIRLSCG
jgi:hypothetical protein